MSIIIRHIWRNIKSNRFRSVLIILSLTLATAVFYLNLNIKNDVYQSTQTIIQGNTMGFDIALAGAVDDITLPETDKELPLLCNSAVINDTDATLYQADLPQIVEDGLISLEEDAGDFEADKSAVMSRTQAKYLNLEPGDSFTVTVDGQDREYTLVSYVDSMGIFGLTGDSLKTVITYSEDFSPNYKLVSFTDNSVMDSVVQNTNNNYYTVRAMALYDSSDVYRHSDSISQILFIILVLVIAIAFYVVFTTDALIISYRIPVLGVFRSVGATATTTHLLLIGENIMYGLISGIFGVGIGEVLRYFLCSVYFKTSSVGFSAAYILLGFLFSIGLNVFISLFFIFKSDKKSIKELISGKQSTATEPSAAAGIVGVVMLAASFVIAYFNNHYNFVWLFVELLLALLGAGMAIGMVCKFVSIILSKILLKGKKGSAWMAARNLRVSKSNRSTALLVMSVLSLVMMIYICVGSISAFFAEYENNYPYDILIKSAQGTEGSFDYIENVDGVESVVYEYWSFEGTYINNEQKRACFCANDGFSNGIEAEEGVLENINDGEVVLDRMFALVNDFEIGDTIEFALYDDSQIRPTFEMKVVGICDSGVFNASRITVIMNRSDFYKYISEEPAIIGITTSRPIEEMISALNDSIAAATGKTYSVWSKTDYVNDDMYEAMDSLQAISAVPVFAAVLALCGLVNNQLIAFNQKRTALAVLYSTAMSRKQIARTIFCEVLFSFIVGCGCGFGLCIWLTKIMRDIIFSSSVYMPLQISVGEIVPSLTILLFLLCLTAIFPLTQLKKLNIVKEIKYE